MTRKTQEELDDLKSKNMKHKAELLEQKLARQNLEKVQRLVGHELDDVKYHLKDIQGQKVTI